MTQVNNVSEHYTLSYIIYQNKLEINKYIVTVYLLQFRFP